MHEADDEKTTFITPDAVFCHLVMAFGLKSLGATYTRMVAKLFGKSMETYVDGMLVNDREDATHADDLAACFQIITKFNLILNPKKFGFAMRGRKFLGYMVIQHGIEPNTEKVKAILEMPPPTSIMEVQRLMGRLVTLNRFLSKSAYWGASILQGCQAERGIRMDARVPCTI